METPLDGGHATPGVVRVGDTVRRPATPASPTIQALLAYLEQVGFDGAPRPRGFDEQGRQVVTYLDGEVASGRPPAYVWEDGTLVGIARLTRRLHDAVEGFVAPADAQWDGPAPADLPHELVCHNDLAPWNTVFRARQPVGFIDWDSAAPGTRLWDLAYLVWHWVPVLPSSRRDEVGAPWHERDIVRRVDLVFRAYGIRRPQQLPQLLVDRQQATIAQMRSRATTGARHDRELWRRARVSLEAEVDYVEHFAARLFGPRGHAPG